MGSIKDRNGRDLTEAEDFKKRWQVYTEELYKKDLHDPDNHNGVITHLEPDILECEVKWALGSIITNKAIRSDGIPVKHLHCFPANRFISTSFQIPCICVNIQYFLSLSDLLHCV